MSNKGYIFSDKIFLNSPTEGKIGVDKAIESIKEFIDAKDSDYQLIIGSDSHLYGSIKSKKNNYLELVTAVVIHRIGNCGKYYWVKNRIKRYFPLKEKIYQETLASLEMAQRLMPYLKKDLNGQYENLEIHIDVGNKGPTREMIKEVVGMVAGNGFRAKTKPESFGAFSVADKFT